MSNRSNNRFPGGDHQEMDAPIDWRGYAHAVRERMWMVILLAVVGAGISFYVIQKAVPVYAAHCVISVERQDLILKQIESVKSDVADTSWAVTMVETMKSSTMMNRVAARFADASSQSAQPTVLVTNRAGNPIIDIVVEHTDPELASKWANALVEEYQKWRVEAIAKATATANDFLVEEADRLREKLTKSELALQEYRERKNAISLEKEQDVVVSRFRELSTQLNESRDRRLSIESDIASSKRVGGNTEELSKLASIAGHPSVVTAQNAADIFENQMAVLKQRYKSRHPKYKSLQTEVDLAKERLGQARIAAAQSLEDAYRDAVAQETRLAEEVKVQEKKTFELSRLQVDYDKLKREIDADKVVYEQVLTRLKETDLTKGLEEIQKVPLKVIEPATASSVPVRPDKRKIMITGTVAGIGLGVLLALGLYFLDSSVRTVHEVEGLLELPVLSAVSIRKKLPSQWKTLPLLDSVHHKHGPISEAFRTLRSALILLGRDEERKVTLITSAVPGEGKSFTACNFAVTLAHQGLRTLLIDLDLRKPTIGKIFFDTQPAAGAADVLAKLVDFTEAIQKSAVENLSLLTAGSRSPNPSELLSGEALGELLQEARRHFDRIVIDSPPVIAVSDPLLISSKVDTILQVVRSHKTPRYAIQRACQALTKAADRPVSGVVLNQLPVKSRSYYYYYYSGYYGEKGVYGAPA
jgi:succinoglycan biosynthesis transport protein ExoP